MKLIAAVIADFEQSASGLASRLSQPLAGKPVLRRTLEQVCRCKGFQSIHLLAAPEQLERATALSSGLPLQVAALADAPPPWRPWVRVARKWSLDGWRGGLGSSTVYDESLNPAALLRLAATHGAEAVADISPAAALLDPALLDVMAAHFEKVREQVRLVFTPSAPGLSAIIYETDLLKTLLESGQGIGPSMAYRPDDPRHDLIMQPCQYPADAAIARAQGRCLADTSTAADRMQRILDELGADRGVPDAANVSRWLTQHELEPADMPAEVEVELTTEDDLAASPLRPRGAAAGVRGPMVTESFERLVLELARRDDARLVLGGFGDPLAHPNWPELLPMARAAGVYAVAVRTPGTRLDAAAAATLIEHRVDVVNVLVDAACAEAYRKVHEVDLFEQVNANVSGLIEAVKKAGRPAPMIVCELLKTRATMPDMEPFYDQWLSRCGAAVIAGPSDYAGQWPDLAVMDMAPPARGPCRRIFSRLTVLADGRVLMCEQDFKGLHPIGSLQNDGLAAAWRSGLEVVRRAHTAAAWNDLPLCPTCREWHRP